MNDPKLTIELPLNEAIEVYKNRLLVIIKIVILNLIVTGIVVLLSMFSWGVALIGWIVGFLGTFAAGSASILAFIYEHPNTSVIFGASAFLAIYIIMTQHTRG